MSCQKDAKVILRWLVQTKSARRSAAYAAHYPYPSARLRSNSDNPVSSDRFCNSTAYRETDVSSMVMTINISKSLAVVNLFPLPFIQNTNRLYTVQLNTDRVSVLLTFLSGVSHWGNYPDVRYGVTVNICRFHTRAPTGSGFDSRYRNFFCSYSLQLCSYS